MPKRGYGATYTIGGTTVGSIESIDTPSIETDMIDVTTLDAADGYKRYIPGALDGGTVKMTGKYEQSNAGQQALLTALNNQTEDTHIITLPTGLGTTITFQGLVKSLKAPGEVNIDDAVGFEIEIQVTGKPIIATTASGGLTALSLTGAGGTLSPSFGAGVRFYSFGGVTASSVTVTATAASHTLVLYIDDVYSQNLTTGVASASITMAIGAPKKLTIIAYEASKAPQKTEIVVIKTA